MNKINLTEKFNLFNEYWSPRIVGELNGQYVKLAKFKGEFMWHSHANEDELFLVVKGTMRIEFRDRVITLSEVNFILYPKALSINLLLMKKLI